MKHLLLITIAAVLLAGCASIKKREVTKLNAKEVLINFFHNLDFENYDRDAFREIVTGDFHIYEMGKHMSRKAFFNFIENTHSKSSVSHDWVLSDIQITTDNQSAHISYKNTGSFVSENDSGKEEMLKIYWLESAYLVLEGGAFKN